MSHPTWAVSPYTREALDALPAQVDETTSPVVIDEALCRMDLEAERIGAQIGRTIEALRKMLGEKKVYPHGTMSGRAKYAYWARPVREVLAIARELPAGWRVRNHYTGRVSITDAVAAYDALHAQSDEIFDARSPLTAQFNERRWERVYLVDNSNGHVHRTMNCRTCYSTTEFKWITELSGATDEQVIELSGERTCLVCFPSVREEILAGRPCRVESREGRDERKAREAEAAAKKAAKVAKGVTADGSPLRIKVDGSTAEIKTERAAELRYVEWSAAAEYYATLYRRNQVADQGALAYDLRKVADYTQGAEEVLAALASKRGTTERELRTALAPKVVRKFKVEYPYV